MPFEFNNETIYEKKDPKYGIQFAQNLEMWHISQFANNFSGNKYQQIQNYQYARGDQDPLRSSRPVDPIGTNDNQTLPGAETENMQLLPQIYKAIKAKLNRYEVQPRISMIDALSIKQRNEFRGKLELLMMLQQQKEDVAPYLEQFQMSEDQIPIDTTELEMMIQTMPQFQEEMYLEMGLEDINQQSNLESLAMQVDGDFICNMKGGYYINRAQGKRELLQWDLINGGISPSKYEDGRDRTWWYGIRMVPLETLRYEAQGDIPKEELDKIRGGYFTLASNIAYFWNPQGGLQYYDTFTPYVLVMDFQFVSTSSFYINEKGEKVYFGRAEKEQGKDGEVEESKVQDLYGGSYVIGWNQIYNYGVKPGIRQPITSNPEDAKNVEAWRVYGDFVIYEADKIFGVSNKSPIEIAKPHITSIDYTFKKYKELVRTFIPWIVQVDDLVLSKLVLKEGGDPISGATIMTTLYEKYFLLTDSSALTNMYNTSMSDLIKIMENPGAGSINTVWTSLINEINLLRDVMGINQLATGGAPQSEQGKAVSMMQAEGTDNVLFTLMFAKKQLYKMLWSNLMYDLLENGGSGIVGNKPYIIPEGNPEERIANLVVEPVPTEAETLRFSQQLDKAIMAETIKPFQIAYLDTIRNMKQKWVYLAVQNKREEDKKQRMGLENIKATGEEQRASNQQTHDNEVQAELLKQRAEAKRMILVEATKAALAPPTSAGEGKAPVKNEIDMEKVAALMMMADTI